MAREECPGGEQPGAAHHEQENTARDCVTVEGCVVEPLRRKVDDIRQQAQSPSNGRNGKEGIKHTERGRSLLQPNRLHWVCECRDCHDSISCRFAPFLSRIQAKGEGSAKASASTA